MGMAELALGGLEMALRPRARSGPCAHDTMLSVTAAGVERSICETCGHISVTFVTQLSGPIYRSRFSRPADGAAETPQASPFAEETQLGVRRRQHVDPESLLLSA